MKLCSAGEKVEYLELLLGVTMINDRTIPGYLHLLETGELASRAATARKSLRNCLICPWNCEVDRLQGAIGVCKTGWLARVYSYAPHMGEEDPLRGWRGSGTIFFTRCNLRCQYCQNYDISQTDQGSEVTPQILAEMMLCLQSAGCHNINFVSPSHVVPQIIEAVYKAVRMGLHIPLVYNTGGYDGLPTLKLLDGIVDIYMPDMKYSDPSVARKYSRIPDYPQYNQAAVLEMHRQVGDLQISHQGLAVRGLLIRHLVLPNELAGTADIARFLAEKVSKDTYINIMAQYHPAFNAHRYPELNRRITPVEYHQAIEAASAAGLHRFDHG